MISTVLSPETKAPRRSMTRIRKNGQITLAASLRRAVHLEEGDPVAVELRSDGILLRPMKLIDATQAWYWESAWQAGEREADEDIQKGRLSPPMSSREFLKSLK